MNIKETKKLIIQAGHRAVEELINVAREKIITNTEDDVSADRLVDLINLKNGNMDIIKNTISLLSQKLGKLVKYLKYKICALRCQNDQCNCEHTN